MQSPRLPKTAGVILVSCEPRRVSGRALPSFPNSGLGMPIPEAPLRRTVSQTATFNRDAQL